MVRRETGGRPPVSLRRWGDPAGPPRDSPEDQQDLSGGPRRLTTAAQETLAGPPRPSWGGPASGSGAVPIASSADRTPPRQPLASPPPRARRSRAHTPPGAH